MRQRRLVVLAIVVCVAGMFGVSCAGFDRSCGGKPTVWPAGSESTFACAVHKHEDDRLIVGGIEHGGLVHFRIGYDDDNNADPRQRQAFKAAMAMWNRHSQMTGFIFEEQTIGEADFRLHRGAPRRLLYGYGGDFETTTCAGYLSPESFIWYSPQGMSWVQNDKDIELAARIYAHELGHALNLCDKCGVISLMRAGDPKEFCEDWAKKAPMEIPEADLRDARVCGHGVRDPKARAPQKANAQQKANAGQ